MEIVFIFLGIIILSYLVIGIIISLKVIKTERLSYGDIWEFDKKLNDLSDDIRNIPYKSFKIQSDEGLTLHARLFEAEEKTKKYVFLNHGNTCVYTGMLKYIDMLKGLKFNVFAPDHRGRGESGGDRNTFGYFEHKDSLKWLDFLFKYDSEAEVALMGESMGGTISLLMAAHDDRIKLVIEDCGFYNAYDSVKHVLVSILGFLGKMILPVVSLMMLLLNKARLNDVNAEEAIKKIKVPVLIIHGEKDTKVPVKSAYILHNANPDNEIEIFKDAEHANCIGNDKGRYYNIIKTFMTNKGFMDDETDKSIM